MTHIITSIIFVLSFACNATDLLSSSEIPVNHKQKNVTFSSPCSLLQYNTCDEPACKHFQDIHKIIPLKDEFFQNNRPYNVGNNCAPLDQEERNDQYYIVFYVDDHNDTIYKEKSHRKLLSLEKQLALRQEELVIDQESALSLSLIYTSEKRQHLINKLIKKHIDDAQSNIAGLKEQIQKRDVKN